MMPTEDFASLLDNLTDLEVQARESWDGLEKPDRIATVRRLPALRQTHDGLFVQQVFRVQNRGRARDSVGAEADGLALAHEVMKLQSAEWHGYWITSFSVSGWPTPLPTSPDSSRRSMLESSYMIQVSTELAGV